ncbi:hypothetical protein ANOM_005680 [Aspergillus nomiae NRRL 13137]|uniref:Uncharacterized protein n=1 Tax=Aspergillus nomiae NRRL (strain ATCC 15546 / NRRL 13137 / CBS 260.88 / M93) TaxID=1509407 RepID=A0A0L1J4C9_ASPN3|nr:uncharacterized protein ANOM_005680 [Aspergillus nomiae NRRL 13137]KNG86666.1 hypothetical protein ANOM_005680 [Aspergillus nomiae NRRL 13137]
MASATTANHAMSVAKMRVSHVVAAVVYFGTSAGVATTLVSDIAVRRDTLLLSWNETSSEQT